MAHEESSKSREIKQMLQSSYTNEYQNEGKITNQCSCQPMGSGDQTSQHSGYTQSSVSNE